MNIENTSYVTLFAMVINVTKTLNNVRLGKTRLGCKKRVKKLAVHPAPQKRYAVRLGANQVVKRLQTDRRILVTLKFQNYFSTHFLLFRLYLLHCSYKNKIG